MTTSATIPPAVACFSEGHDPVVIETYSCGPDRWTEIFPVPPRDKSPKEPR